MSTYWLAQASPVSRVGSPAGRDVRTTTALPAGPTCSLPSRSGPQPGSERHSVFDIAVILTVFALIFVGELPDKTAVAGLVLGTRFPWRWAFAGVAAAFLTHVVIAVSAGSLLSLLPRRVVEGFVA